MKKEFNIINIIFAILILVGDICYMAVDTLWLKSTTSILFVILGGVNLFVALKNETQYKHFSILLFMGLIFACLGDIVLELHFISGAILFAIGHIFYFISYTSLVKFRWKDLLYGLAIFIPSVLFITLAPIFDFGGILMEIVCIMYALIISLMVGKSISNFVKVGSLLHLIIMIGSILFFFSDLMLLLNVFADLGMILNILCLSTYYPAEFILAYSIYQTIKVNKLCK